ncbi:MAG TPA: HDOD domain-containing protein [Kofleriaceae bacterium]|nr:HDOD domain-containing protein [Kofleriaceae bacterium]
MLPQVRDRFDALIASGKLPLPLLPEVAAQVLAMVERPDCDARKLAELFKRDPAMTAHVMQVAGSPMYASATKIVSLQQAIGRLGFTTIIQIAMVVASKTRVFQLEGFEAEVKAAFRHALATALYAQEIARSRRSTVDSAFLAGLFHDFGQPVLLQALVDLHREAKLEPDHDDVMAAVDAAHAAVGGSLVDSWQMPAKVAEAVRLHHTPEGCELATLVALADSFAHGAPQQALAAPLNMYPEDVEAIANKADDIDKAVEAIA